MINNDKTSEADEDYPHNPLVAAASTQLQSMSKDSLRQLSFQHMQDGFAIVDLRGLFVDANPAFYRMTGFSPQEYANAGPIHPCWPPEELDIIQGAYAGTLSGDFTQIELTFMRKNGERFPVILNPFAIEDPTGNACYYATTVVDVSQQTAMKVALNKSEGRFRALFENAGDGIVILEDDRIVDCNDRILELYNISRDQLFGCSGFDLAPPTQPNGQISRKFINEKTRKCLLGKPQTFEWACLKYDGTPIDTEVTLASFMSDGKRYTQSIVRDITQRKQMENALKDSEVRFRTLFENAGDAIAIMKNVQIIDCNKQLLELYGYSREEAFSNPTTRFFLATQPGGKCSHQFFREKIAASRSGTPQIFEWHGRKKDGTPVITEVTLTTFRVGDDDLEQAISRDITQRKRMESALLELNRTLENRVAQRTEELEKACAELLQRNLQFRALARKLTKAEEEERRRIARLLHDNHQQLLAAAKFKAEMLESGLQNLNMEELGQQIVEILDQALEVTRALTMELAPPILYGQGFVSTMQWLGRWMEEHHNLRVVVNGSLPLTPMPTDVSNLLFRAVRELLFNVSKHSGVQEATVSIALVEEGIAVTVIDTGVGFDVANVLQTRSYGLFSIQEQLIPLHGRLDISSIPGSGTRSTLMIPMPAADYLHLEAASEDEEEE